MKKILIVGAGGFGREVYNYVEDCIKAGANWLIKGFLDDNLNALDSYDYPNKKIYLLESYIPEDDDICICALGNPKTKKIVVEKLLAKGAKFETLVHPSAHVGRNVKIGAGCVVCPNCVLTCDSSLGDFVMLNVGTSVGHDAKIGQWCTISSHCDITGFVNIAEGAFLASSVVVIPSSSVGEWATVGVNSSVITKVRDNTTVYGNPAIKLK